MVDPLDQMKTEALSQTETVQLSPVTRLREVPAPAVPPRLKFQFEMAGDIEITEYDEYLVEDLVPLKGLMSVYGGPGSGKTFLTFDLSGHVAAGLDYFGRPVQPGGVVYIAAEAGAGVRKRAAAWRKKHSHSGHLPLALVKVAPNLGTVDAKQGADCDTLINEIRAQLPRLGAPLRMVVIDTLARAMAGADENSGQDMGAFITNAGRIAEEFDCMVVAVHHTGKDTDRGMRGHSSLHGACDAEWEVKDQGDGGRTVTLAKMKDGEDGLTWSFALDQVVILDPLTTGAATTGFVAEKRPVTSCFINELSEPQQRTTTSKRREPQGNKGEVLESVREAVGLHGEEMPRSPDLPGGKGVKRQYVIDIARKRNVGNPDNPRSQTNEINRALGNLSGDGWIKSRDKWVWLCE